MRSRDIAEALKPFLEPVEGCPHVKAMRPPPTPRRIDDSAPGTSAAVNRAHAALAWLKGTIAGWLDRDLLTRTLARREAVQSSQIEGTRSGLDALLAFEVTRSLDGKLADVVETERYVQALQVGLDSVRAQGRKALNRKLLHRLHATLMVDRLDAANLGRYRTDYAWIGSAQRIEDATFVPSPPAHIAAGMAELERSILQYRPRDDEAFEIGIVPQLAIAHAQFETIHPYKDGNGRTGRLLMPLLLDAEGWPPLYVSGALLRRRSEYYDALAQVQTRSRWAPWVKLLSEAIVESAHDAVAVYTDLQALRREWERRVVGVRSDSVAARLLPLLIGHPVVDAKRVRVLLDVSDPAARNGLRTLVEHGILAAPSDRRWGRTFHAIEVIERLNRAPG